jgi:hypothetical protein
MATITTNCFVTDSSFLAAHPTTFVVIIILLFAAIQDLVLSQAVLMGSKIMQMVALKY